MFDLTLEKYNKVLSVARDVLVPVAVLVLYSHQK